MDSKTMLLIDAEELKALIEDSVQHAVKDVISEFNNQDDSDLLTINETSKMLRKSRTWLWRMEKDKVLTPIMVGGSKMYKKSVINKLMEG